MAGKKGVGGMAAIEMATAHYSAQDRREIIVSEWQDGDGEPLSFYVTPFTLYDQNKLQNAIKNGDEANALAEVVYLKALDEDGNKIFTVADKSILRSKVDANVLARVAAEIMGGEDVEDLEKN